MSYSVRCTRRACRHSTVRHHRAAAPLPYIASLLAEQSGRDENPKPTKTSLFSHRKRLVRQRLQDFCHENKEILVTTTRAPQDVNDIIKKIRRVAAPQGHGLVR